MTPNLYIPTEYSEPYIFKSRDKWLDLRIHGIGGSDSSAFIGMNPYKSKQELWREKKGKVPAPDISNEATKRGVLLEPIIREWFKATHQEYDVQYHENAIFQSKQIDTQFMLYSPDSLLYHEEEGKGILEIKTSLIQNKIMLDQWNEQIPNPYFIQTLHGLLTLGEDYQFVYLVAHLQFAWNDRVEIRTYKFTREEVQEDLDFLKKEEISNWTEFYLGDKEPAIVISL